MDSTQILLRRLCSIVDHQCLGPHKGTNGRLLIVGGSDEYVGAPVFAARAAMTTGVDLVHVWTSSSSASAAIKVLLPDCIVTHKPRWNDYTNDLLGPFDTILIGCGWGRDNFTDKWSFMLRVVAIAANEHKFVVLDGDALWMCAQASLKPSIGEVSAVSFYPIIMTPNPVEMKRLLEFEGRKAEQWPHQATFKGQSFGSGGPIVAVFEKRERDSLHVKSETFNFDYLEAQEGSKRRFGGQGDILAGILSAVMAMFVSDKRRPDPVIALSQPETIRTLLVFGASFAGLSLRVAGQQCPSDTSSALLKNYARQSDFCGAKAVEVFQRAVNKTSANS